MLTKRLEYIVNSIPRCNTLADVGCDHGYVGIEALTRGVAEQVIFVDISFACLNKARSSCPTALNGKTQFVCRNGLGDIRCDVAVICGMGGLEIMSILNNAQTLPQTVVLQPMRNIVETRNYVAEHYTITQDVTVFDGKFYSVIVGERLGSPTRKLTDLETEFGLTNINEPSDDFIKYLLNEQTKLNAILQNCNADGVSQRLAKVNKALEQTRRKL